MDTIENFTTKFLSYKTGIIFLFTLLITFSWHSSINPTSDYITAIVNLAGQIGIISWLYAVASKSNKVLIKKGQELKLFRNFQINFLILILTFILLFILSFINPATLATKSDFERGEAFTYKRILLLLGATLIIAGILAWRGAAKLLVSAENGKEQSFEHYYKTLLLLIFSWIGVWFIHPRAQTLK